MSKRGKQGTTPFLTAEWRHLVILNYEIDPAALRPLVPRGTELDNWQKRTLVSLVGFLFLNTRVLGLPIPWHRNFEEVNLRFYVRRRTEDGWRRAVVFVKELVPRIAIAFLARTLYGENYVALPMGHRIDRDNDAKTPRNISYWWRFKNRKNSVQLSVQGAAEDIATGSEQEFITEHYWGYTRLKNGRTKEYRVEHPRWRVYPVSNPQLDCDVGPLYGEQFVKALQAPPVSAFLAEGSVVKVHKGIDTEKGGQS